MLTAYIPVPQYYPRQYEFTPRSGPGSPLFLAERDHGYGPLSSPAQPISILSPLPLHNLYLDGLPHLSRLIPNQKKTLLDQLLLDEVRLAPPDSEIIRAESLPVSVSDLDEYQTAKKFTRTLTSWIQTTTLPQVVSVDFFGHTNRHYSDYPSSADIKELYNDFSSALEFTTLSAALVGLPVRRSHFLRLCATVSSAIALDKAVNFITAKDQLLSQSLQAFAEQPDPSEVSPAGFRGIVEHLLQNPTRLSPLTLSVLLRDLTAAYKTRVLHSDTSPDYADYSAWGTGHLFQIGLLELSPAQILAYLRQFVLRFPDFISQEFDSTLPSHQLWTSTSYTVQANPNPYTIQIDSDQIIQPTGFTQVIFPQLYHLFPQIP